MTLEHSELERARAGAQAVSPQRLSLARRIFPGLLAAAASAGVIVGAGWRGGTSLAPFTRLGGSLLASRVGAALPAAVHAMTGLVIHTFWLMLWGFCFTAVARSLRGGKLFIAASAATLLLWLLTRAFFPLALGAAEWSLMSTAHSVLYLVAITVAFAFGTRIARYA